jgi:hypothetical protein
MSLIRSSVASLLALAALTTVAGGASAASTRDKERPAAAVDARASVERLNGAATAPLLRSGAKGIAVTGRRSCSTAPGSRRARSTGASAPTCDAP